MSARFMIAMLSAGALIATLSTASPATAGNNDNLKKFVGAAVGLYILGRAIENHRDDRKDQRAKPRHAGNGHWKHDYRQKTHTDRRYDRSKQGSLGHWKYSRSHNWGQGRHGGPSRHSMAAK